MTLRNLQIFVAVAESGSMVKAAKQLYMTQPSISQSISELEKTYNVNLFERRNKSLVLTQTGDKFLKYAKKTIMLAQETEDFLKQQSTHPQISVGATPTIGACFMSSIVRRLQDTNPNLIQHVCIANSSTILGRILEGKTDIALVEGRVENAELEYREVIRDRLVLICSKNHEFAKRVSVDIKELNGQSLVVREKGSAIRSQIYDALIERNIEPIISWGSTDYDSIIDAVRDDLGVGIISERFSRRSRVRSRLHVCDILGMDVSFNYRLVYRKGRVFPEELNEFIHICEEFGALDDILAKNE